MTDFDFHSLADAALDRIERALEASGAEVEMERAEGGALHVEFANGTEMVINQHAAAREIWVAGKAGGFHFRWDGASWRDTRDGSELFVALSKLVSAQGGQAVRLA